MNLKTLIPFPSLLNVQFSIDTAKKLPINWLFLSHKAKNLLYLGFHSFEFNQRITGCGKVAV